MDMDAIIARVKKELAPAVAVVKCSACGQWSARFCECKRCGYPVD